MLNALEKWLSLEWDRPERSYNPDLRDFLAGLLGYPKKNVVTEDTAAGGFADLQLLSPEGNAWIVGDLKKDDNLLTDSNKRNGLWEEKRKYVSGLTRYALFVTPKFIWLVLPDGSEVPGLAGPLDLTSNSLAALQEKLNPVTFEKASHDKQWGKFIEGSVPYSYLDLGKDNALDRLRLDLQDSFEELTASAERAVATLGVRHKAYSRLKKEVETNLQGESQRRAIIRLENEYAFERGLFEEALPQFNEQYGREIDSKNQVEKRVHEAFIADSVAALVARVLFLRLVEDLGLISKRMLSDGGPKRWSEFVAHLTGDAKMLVRIAAEDVGRIYRETFSRTVFDWINIANGELDASLQKLILRLNAYNFAGLSEEILGDIYQSFLPVAKRKRLGEFYTPPSIIEWILDHTVREHGLGKLLDPSCGSGSFLVRYTNWRLEDAKRRKLDPHVTRQEVQAEIWGFDLNPFASFISHFQLMWALLRYLPASDPPDIHIYNLNALLRDNDIAAYLGEEHLPAGAVARDGEKWKYILGNPPYIRAERSKYGSEMKTTWSDIWGQNADTGLVFLYRALTEWLEDDGFLGMVVSGGYANSSAAAKIWELLYPGKKAALRKVVWLEFAGKFWDANVIPMILIIERTPAKDDDEIELITPEQWPDEKGGSKIKYSDFFDYKVNPKVVESDHFFGNYLLPLLTKKDIPVLKDLYPGGAKAVGLNTAVAKQISGNNRTFWWTFGVQRGGVSVTKEKTSKNSVQVVAGRGLAMAWPGVPEGWLDLDAVSDRPNGKLSLWRNGIPEKYIGVVYIGLAPAAVVIDSTEEFSKASLNSVIVALPKSGGPPPEVVAGYLNSRLIRYYWLVTQRSGVLEGSSRSQVYPRTLEALPWPKKLDKTLEEKLVAKYNELTALAQRAKDNPSEWLLRQLEDESRAKKSDKLTDPRFGADFSGWGDDVLGSNLTLEDNKIQTGLFSMKFADAEIAEFVFRVLALTGDGETVIKDKEVQKLLVPKDFRKLISDYKAKLASFETVESEFMEVLGEIDEAVYDAFDLEPDVREHIEQRLNSFPLNRLKPRYPWQVVKPRSLKAYTEDRFA